jgi:flagellar assembly protein FliH
MATPVKFLFDTEFDSVVGEPRSDEPVDELHEDILLPEVYSADDIKAASEQEFSRGERAGAEQAGTQIEAEIAQSLKQLCGQVDALTADYNRTQQQIGRDATELAVAIARKLSSTLVARAPMAEMETMIRSCLSEQHSEPKIVARVSDQMITRLKNRVDNLTSQSGFLGDLVLIADDSLVGSACRVEWADGGAERNPRALESAVETAVNNFIEASYPQASESRATEAADDEQVEIAPPLKEPAGNEPAEPKQNDQ